MVFRQRITVSELPPESYQWAVEYFSLVGSTVAVTEGLWQDVLAVACGIFSAEDLDQLAPVVLGEIDRLVPPRISWFNGDDPLAGRVRVVSRPYININWVPYLEAWRRWSHQDLVLA
jgi:hypothetical protein